MTSPAAGSPPRLKARTAGLLYLVTIVTGMFAITVRSGVIVHGDAAVTASRIMASETPYRLAFAGELIGTLCYVAITAILYELLKPVSRSVSRLAAFVSLAGCAVGAAISTNLLAPLVLLGGAPYLAVFRPDQLQALALISLKMHDQGYAIAMVFFGFYCLLLGYLVFRSTFLPKILGVLLALAGLGWLTSSFASLVAPSLAGSLYPYVMIPGLFGEGSLCLWLILFGVNAGRWREQADVAFAGRLG